MSFPLAVVGQMVNRPALFHSMLETVHNNSVPVSHTQLTKPVIFRDQSGPSVNQQKSKLEVTLFDLVIFSTIVWILFNLQKEEAQNALISNNMNFESALGE
ncbi:MAG: hypothetical protein KAG66_02760 [Methylococcales bacterium]|nr:hypothetical protein [Methylococcales bacterium]